MLDYDGTLSPFTEKRDKALLYPGAGEILEQLIDGGDTRIVIVTGRTVESLMSLLTLKSIPEIWGSHGWERRGSDGSYYIWPASTRHLEGLGKLENLLTHDNLDKKIERKPRSLALHWRGSSRRETDFIKDLVDTELRKICTDFGLEIRDFDKGVEFRVPGRSKGDVVETLRKESPEDCLMAYVGDDYTDEDAFEALGDNGAGILMGDRRRRTNARYYLETPDELLEFLRSWRDTVEGGSISAG